MNIKHSLVLGFITFFISGCGTTEYKTIYRTKLVKVKPPVEIINYKIVTPIPPDKEEFVSGTPVEREKMLIFYSIKLLDTIKKYKIKNKNFKEWYNEINKTIEGGK